MRRISSSLCIALCLSLPIVWAGCASTPSHRSTGEYVDDSVITTKVKSALAADKMLSLFQISVETRDGVVSLSGDVKSREMVEQAGAVSQKVNGVRQVKNNLVVKP